MVDLDRLAGFIHDSLIRLGLPGGALVVVDRDGELLRRAYGSVADPRTPMVIGSLSKSFTAAAIMRLVERGRIDVDAPVVTYLPDWADGARVTVRQLLQHTSGLGPRQRRRDAAVGAMLGRHRYANVNYTLLGQIVEAVTQTRYGDHLRREIFEPLGMTSSAACREDTRATALAPGHTAWFGVPVRRPLRYPGPDAWEQPPAGYLSSSAVDLGAYLRCFLRDGGDLLAASSVRAMMTDTAPTQTAGVGYGFGWFVGTDAGQRLWWHAGLVENYMSEMVVLPDRGLAAALLVPGTDYLVATPLMARVHAGIVAILSGREPDQLPARAAQVRHAAINAGLVGLATAALGSLLWARRVRREASWSGAVAAGLIHGAAPVGLALVPRCAGATHDIARRFAPDLYVVTQASAVLLGLGGVVRLLRRTHPRAADNFIKPDSR